MILKKSIPYESGKSGLDGKVPPKTNGYLPAKQEDGVDVAIDTSGVTIGHSADLGQMGDEGIAEVIDIADPLKRGNRNIT